ncbi:MAG TPA: hypothetical protein VFW33_10640 [Gemmataceae bacterium]|nr:hypothetical protein [Gemmataceae bacterium]
MKLSAADRRKLLPLLDELAGAVEELLLSGLTTASEATRQALGVSFQEASRLGLLRLGSTLRAANEELGRFTRNEPEFSRRRLGFFLNRAWLLCRGLSRALHEGDEAQFDRLLWTPASAPAGRLEVVTLGVARRVAASAFCAFEFRLRTVAPAGAIPAGQRLIWSCVFALKPGVSVPPEAFLGLPQKQKFKPALFLERKTVVIEGAAVALDGDSGRVSLGEQSTVVGGEPFTDWQRFQGWDPAAALRRVRSHEPGPFDLEVELQEEVVLDVWEIGEPAGRAGQHQTVFPVTHRGTAFDAVVTQGEEGKALRGALEALRRKKQRAPLFGLLHYEMCRLVLQPLAVFGKDGPEQLMLSQEAGDRAALLKALKF